jgi:hypothetical protein
MTSVTILEVLANREALGLFNIIAQNGNIGSKSLQSATGTSNKVFYSKLKQLINFGLVERRNRIYYSTSLGSAVYKAELLIDAAIKEYSSLKAIDSILEVDKIGQAATKELVENIINDTHLKSILLEKSADKYNNKNNNESS